MLSKHERIIASVNTTMAVEGMALDKAQKEKMRDCLSGKVSYEDAVKKAIDKYRQPAKHNG